MSIRRPDGDEPKRLYHHPAYLGQTVRCPHCGGFGPTNGSERNETGSHLTQWRRCRDCGAAYTTSLKIEERSN